MSIYLVNKVRKETASNKSHEHIVGVVTTAGAYHSNQSVIDSMRLGHQWFTDVPGQVRAAIRKRDACPMGSCLHTPYLTTDPDHTEKNNLENLPRG